MLQLADTAYDGDVSVRRSTIRKDHGAELLETPCFAQGFCETFGADMLRFAYGYLLLATRAHIRRLVGPDSTES